jgi:hypothetical protein
LQQWQWQLLCSTIQQYPQHRSKQWLLPLHCSLPHPRLPQRLLSPKQNCVRSQATHAQREKTELNLVSEFLVLLGIFGSLRCIFGSRVAFFLGFLSFFL